MASRIIHYAVTKLVADKIQIEDKNRLFFGAILPDAYDLKTFTMNKSHYKITICNGTKKTYDLTRFRHQFGNEMQTDDLYLGYYLHLIQDILYRQFIYGDYKWNPLIEGNVERLHNDYRLINTYVIQKYGLRNNILLPKDFSNEKICEICPFEIEKMMLDLQGDFENYNSSTVFFFTEKMADEYIAKAVNACLKEVEGLKTNDKLLDENQCAWN